MSSTLAILIAKSGVALLDLLPREWEVVVADYSRLDQREVQWWSRLRAKRYDEIIILDQNVTTGLTQLRLERELRCMGVEGPVRYAGNPKTLLAYRHMDYMLGRGFGEIRRVVLFGRGARPGAKAPNRQSIGECFSTHKFSGGLCQSASLPTFLESVSFLLINLVKLKWIQVEIPIATMRP